MTIAFIWLAYATLALALMLCFGLFAAMSPEPRAQYKFIMFGALMEILFLVLFTSGWALTFL